MFLKVWESRQITKEQDQFKSHFLYRNTCNLHQILQEILKVLMILKYVKSQNRSLDHILRYIDFAPL